MVILCLFLAYVLSFACLVWRGRAEHWPGGFRYVHPTEDTAPERICRILYYPLYRLCSTFGMQIVYLSVPYKGILAQCRSPNDSELSAIRQALRRLQELAALSDLKLAEILGDAHLAGQASRVLSELTAEIPSNRGLYVIRPRHLDTHTIPGVLTSTEACALNLDRVQLADGSTVVLKHGSEFASLIEFNERSFENIHTLTLTYAFAVARLGVRRSRYDYSDWHWQLVMRSYLGHYDVRPNGVSFWEELWTARP